MKFPIKNSQRSHGFNIFFLCRRNPGHLFCLDRTLQFGFKFKKSILASEVMSEKKELCKM